MSINTSIHHIVSNNSVYWHQISYHASTFQIICVLRCSSSVRILGITIKIVKQSSPTVLGGQWLQPRLPKGAVLNSTVLTSHSWVNVTNQRRGKLSSCIIIHGNRLSTSLIEPCHSLPWRNIKMVYRPVHSEKLYYLEVCIAGHCTHIFDTSDETEMTVCVEVAQELCICYPVAWKCAW